LIHAVDLHTKCGHNSRRVEPCERLLENLNFDNANPSGETRLRRRQLADDVVIEAPGSAKASTGFGASHGRPSSQQRRKQQQRGCGGGGDVEMQPRLTGIAGLL